MANLKISETAFTSVVIWGSNKTLSALDNKEWLTRKSPTLLNGNLLARTWWKLYYLSNELNAEGCDVLFVPGGSYTGKFRPFVTMSRNMLPFEFNEMCRFGFSWMLLKIYLLRAVQIRTFRKASGLIFLSEYAREKTLEVTGALKAEQKVIPHGINEIFFNPGRVLEEKEKPNLHIIYVSIIHSYKHQWHVVHAISQLRIKGYLVTIEFVGPAYPPALKMFSRAVEAVDPEGEFITYRGDVSNNRLPQLYRDADICLFASTCENLPNILLEGMASGLPVASSNKGPMPDILGDAGVYFDPEKPEQIMKALEKLILSRELRIKLAKRSQEIAQHYSWVKAAGKTFAFLDQMASQSLANKIK